MTTKLRPTHETKRLAMIMFAAERALATKGEPFYKSALFTTDSASDSTWAGDTLWIWCELGILKRYELAKSAYVVANTEEMTRISKEPEIASWYVSSRRQAYHSTGVRPPHMAAALDDAFASIVGRLTEPDESDVVQEPVMEPVMDPMEAYLSRTVSVLENLDARQRELLTEIKDQSDLVLNAVGRLEGVASRDDVAGAAAKLIQAVSKPVDLSSISKGLSRLHDDIGATNNTVETVMAHLGRSFGDRLDAQWTKTDQRIAALESKLDAAVKRIEATQAPDLKPFQELLNQLIENVTVFTKLKTKTNEAQDRYLDHMTEGVNTAKNLIAVAFAIVKSAGASPEEIADAIRAASTPQTLAAVGLAMRATDGADALARGPMSRPDLMDEEPKLNRRTRRALKANGL